MKRRKFIYQIGTGLAATLLPSTILSFTPSIGEKSALKNLTFGIVADVHKDLMPDADKRLETFITKSKERQVDFIVQLGDFCMADKKNKDFLAIWNQFKGAKYHVLGNHDMDKHSKQEMLDFWGMPKTYYSYDFGGYHFIVLDANFIYKDGKFTDYNKANFYIDDSARTFINDEQIEWFKADLESTKLPTIVFSHQSLWHYKWGVKNRLTLQKSMEIHKEKVICCFNGHNHIDYHRHMNGIDYIEINSMSYHWMSNKYKSKERFAKEHYKTYKWLPNVAAYEKPLYTFVTLNPKGILTVEGIKSNWISPSPYEMGMKKGFEGMRLSAEISDYSIDF